MVRAAGYYQPGFGQASQSISLQIPKIAADGFEEIRNYYPATLNVRFEPMVIVAKSQYRTNPIRWKGDQPVGEIFDFIQVRLLFKQPEVQAKALLYISHWTVYRLDPHMHEFLVDKFIGGLQSGTPVLMECDREAIELPYRNRTELNGQPYRAHTIVIL